MRLDDWIGETYAPKLMIAEAERFIAANRSRPFLLYLPFIEPHLAMHPPRKSVEQFPEEWDTKPYRGQYGYLPHPRPRAGYAAIISDLDGYVGRVMAALEEAGVADHTLVVFTSDKGTTLPRTPDAEFHVGGVDAPFFNSTGGLRGYKGSVYEGGIRVPMIVRLPGRELSRRQEGTHPPPGGHHDVDERGLLDQLAVATQPQRRVEAELARGCLGAGTRPGTLPQPPRATLLGRLSGRIEAQPPAQRERPPVRIQARPCGKLSRTGEPLSIGHGVGNENPLHRRRERRVRRRGTQNVERRFFVRGGCVRGRGEFESGPSHAVSAGRPMGGVPFGWRSWQYASGCCVSFEPLTPSPPRG